MNEIDDELNAEAEHTCWSNWMNYMFSKGIHNPDGTWTMPHWAVERWGRQLKTPYAELSESEKQSDRDVFQEYHGTMVAALRGELAQAREELAELKSEQDNHDALRKGALASARAELTALRERQRWIESENRFPEIGQLVLVQYESGFIETRVYDPNWSTWSLSLRWMPIPEANDGG